MQLVVVQERQPRGPRFQGHRERDLARQPQLDAHLEGHEIRPGGEPDRDVVGHQPQVREDQELELVLLDHGHREANPRGRAQVPPRAHGHRSVFRDATGVGGLRVRARTDVGLEAQASRLRDQVEGDEPPGDDVGISHVVLAEGRAVLEGDEAPLPQHERSGRFNRGRGGRRSCDIQDGVAAVVPLVRFRHDVVHVGGRPRGVESRGSGRPDGALDRRVFPRGKRGDRDVRERDPVHREADGAGSDRRIARVTERCAEHGLPARRQVDRPRDLLDHEVPHGKRRRSGVRHHLPALGRRGVEVPRVDAPDRRGLVAEDGGAQRDGVRPLPIGRRHVAGARIVQSVLGRTSAADVVSGPQHGGQLARGALADAGPRELSPPVGRGGAGVVAGVSGPHRVPTRRRPAHHARHHRRVHGLLVHHHPRGRIGNEGDRGRRGRARGERGQSSGLGVRGGRIARRVVDRRLGFDRGVVVEVVDPEGIVRLGVLLVQEDLHLVVDVLVVHTPYRGELGILDHQRPPTRGHVARGDALPGLHVRQVPHLHAHPLVVELVDLGREVLVRHAVLAHHLEGDVAGAHRLLGHRETNEHERSEHESLLGSLQGSCVNFVSFL